MTIKHLSLFPWILFLLLPTVLDCRNTGDGQAEKAPDISLPAPVLTGEMTLEEALHLRRSVRDYTAEPLLFQHLSQLLWAAQGITSEEGFRTAPSAGALYPLEIYAVVGNVETLPPGLYKYLPSNHSLCFIKPGDLRRVLAEQALDQEQIQEAAVDIIIAAEHERTRSRYDDRGRRYVLLEAGHAGQNLCLQACSLDLGICPVGAFDDDGVRKVLDLPETEAPLYIFSVGNVR